MKNTIEINSTVLNLDDIIGIGSEDIHERLENEIGKKLIFKIYFTHYCIDIEYATVYRENYNSKFNEADVEIIKNFRKLSTLLKKLVKGEIDMEKFNSENK